MDSKGYKDYTGKYPTFNDWAEELKKQLDRKQGYMEKLKEKQENKNAES